jgi:hypothetical protein
MYIFSIKLNGVDHTLSIPIEVVEDVSYMRGKQVYILSIDKFHLYALCRDIEMGKKVIVEELNLVIDSYLFEENYVVSQNALEFKNVIMRHVYG